jgi:hypothetical protein
MTRTVLSGLSGTSPLGFLGALGLLRLLRRRRESARLGFLDDGSFSPFVDCHVQDLPALVAEDASAAEHERGWRLEYEKKEKNATKTVADLKAPPSDFALFLRRAINDWLGGETESAAYAAAFGTSTAVDGKGNTKPTAFHFTAAQQKFLVTVELVRAMVTREWAQQSLFTGAASRPGPNLRWDPGAERNWALMSDNPNTEGTSVDAPTEWLAFRALPLFPTLPLQSRVITTAIKGRGADMTFTWPLWSIPASLATVRSVLVVDWTGPAAARRARGVFAVCASTIRRTSQGFGNFGPARVTT